MTRPERFARRQFTYELLTTAFEGGEQAAIVPNAERVIGIRRELAQMPAKNGHTTLPSLVALAGDWAVTSQFPAADRYHVALALEEKLRDSGRFQYSLKGTARDLALDPIEDFIVNHPQGHCEYFATALALMLRSQAFQPGSSSDTTATNGMFRGNASLSVNCTPTRGWKHSWSPRMYHGS